MSDDTHPAHTHRTRSARGPLHPTHNLGGRSAQRLHAPVVGLVAADPVPDVASDAVYLFNDGEGAVVPSRGNLVDLALQFDVAYELTFKRGMLGMLAEEVLVTVFSELPDSRRQLLEELQKGLPSKAPDRCELGFDQTISSVWPARCSSRASRAIDRRWHGMSPWSMV